MFRIFYFTLKNNFKTIWMSISVIAITLVMASALGNAIENMQETGVYSKESVAVYNDLSPYYKEEFYQLLQDENLNEIIVFEMFDDTESMENLLEEGLYTTIVIASNIDGKDSIVVESTRSDSFMYTVGLNFTSTVNTISLICNNAVFTQDMENQYSNAVLKNKELEKGYPIGIDYYGIQHLFQMTALLAVLGAFSVLDDRNKNVFPRLRTAPISKFKIASGRLIANVLYMVVIQIIIAVILGKFMDVNWGENYLLVVTTFALYSICVMCVGMTAAVLTKSVMASIGIILGIGSTLWPRFSGAFSPYYKVGPLAYISPNFHAKNVLFSSIYGGSQKVIFEGLIWMTGLAIVFVLGYALAERVKKDESI